MRVAFEHSTGYGCNAEPFGEVPCLCLRIPTGGGKTLLGAHAIGRMARAWPGPTLQPLALWLVPSDAIRSQTLAALSAPGHPLREALALACGDDVRVCELDGAAALSPQDFDAHAVVVVATMQSFRIACVELWHPAGKAPLETSTMSSPPIRVLLAKVGLDGHDRGVKVVARTLRDAGMDVIYSGLHRTPEEVVNTAVQEDVDVLGVSLLSGVQMTVFPKLFRLLDERQAKDIIVIAGGVMPDEDVVELKKMGVAAVLLQDTPPQSIIDTLTTLVRERGRR